MQPLVKYVGGKARLVERLRPLLPMNYLSLRHVEPFAGGASLFFFCEPPRARLSDTNTRLMAMYAGVADAAGPVAAHLDHLFAAHSTKVYYHKREMFNRAVLAPREIAALFIYLTSTCFNGVYRENARGEFNVSIGDYPEPTRADDERLRRAGILLRQTELLHGDFESTLTDVGRGDFVFLDPPYHVLPKVGATSGFTGYGAAGFTEADHKRLRRVFGQLDKRGAKLLMTNSGTRFIKNLYRDFDVQELGALRSVGRHGETRKVAPDVVVRNYT